jgi:hypothetical protein
MNKKILLLICMLITSCCYRIYAQFTFVGASVNWGSWIKEIGGSACAVYTINNKIDIVPNATYFFPHEEIIETPLDTGTVTYTWWSANLDGHYVVLEKSKFQLFGLMGLNITNETKFEDYITQGQRFKYKTVTTKPALNLGAGVQFPLSKFFTPFIELKYVLGERHQAVASLGVLVRIAPDREREEY